MNIGIKFCFMIIIITANLAVSQVKLILPTLAHLRLSPPPNGEWKPKSYFIKMPYDWKFLNQLEIKFSPPNVEWIALILVS